MVMLCSKLVNWCMIRRLDSPRQGQQTSVMMCGESTFNFDADEVVQLGEQGPVIVLFVSSKGRVLIVVLHAISKSTRAYQIPITSVTGYIDDVAFDHHRWLVSRKLSIHPWIF
ncbi:hypothetical protein ACQ4PT_043466 [Festuca glaucescens]